jgi:hypothetical protein
MGLSVFRAMRGTRRGAPQMQAVSSLYSQVRQVHECVVEVSVLTMGVSVDGGTLVQSKGSYTLQTRSQ